MAIVIPQFNNQASSNAAAAERPREEFWLNIGWYASAVNENGEQFQQFISLNYGIPLSSVKEEKLGSNPAWNALVQAKNGILHQLLAKAKELKPGETFDIGEGDGPVLQIRRVGEKVVVADNPLEVKIF